MLPGWVTRTLHPSTPTSNNYAGSCKAARGSWRMLGGQIKPLRFRIMQTTSGPRSFMQGSNPSSALFSAQRPRFETGMACGMLLTDKEDILKQWTLHFSTLLNRTSEVTNEALESIQQRPMIPELDAPPNTAETAIKQLQTGKARDQMEYQPRCSKPVVKPLSLTLPGCSRCSGSMGSSHGTSGMPTCTKTRVIAHPATTTAGSASSAL